MNLNDSLAIEFINRFQGGFPITHNPYLRVANELGTDEKNLISTIANLLEDGWLSRFGPLYDASKMGGGLTLAAISVAEDRFGEVTEIVNSFSEVAHNYRREHQLNMWFVVATEIEQTVGTVLKSIEKQTGLQVYNCPKLQEFYVGLQLDLSQEGQVDTIPLDTAWCGPGRNNSIPKSPGELERKIISSTQTGLPLAPRPYEQIAIQIGSDCDSVKKRLQNMLDRGVLRRIGAVPNHYKLGLRGNGMSVWDVPAELVTEIGKKIGSMDFVSHCYERPRHPSIWPYNLFAMVHGSDREQVMKKLAVMESELNSYKFPHDVLFSSAILKKTGLRIAA